MVDRAICAVVPVIMGVAVCRRSRRPRECRVINMLIDAQLLACAAVIAHVTTARLGARRAPIVAEVAVVTGRSMGKLHHRTKRLIGKRRGWSRSGMFHAWPLAPDDAR